MAFLYALPGAVAEGLIWGLMGIGVYISYKILDIADLTVDGSICTGACVCAMLLTMGLPVWLCMLLALLAGMLSGVVTGLLHTALGIPSILAGILTQLMLYSVNLAILGGKSMVAINPRSTTLLVHMSNNPGSIAAMVAIVAAMIVILWLFFYTEIGLTLKSTGDNPDMSRAQGVDVKRNKVIGLAIANGIVALAGALLAQYKGSANINDGRGAIVIGLAAIVRVAEDQAQLRLQPHRRHRRRHCVLHRVQFRHPAGPEDGLFEDAFRHHRGRVPGRTLCEERILHQAQIPSSQRRR